MPQYPILPGQSRTLRRGELRDRLIALGKKHEQRLAVVLEHQIDMLIDDLRIITPKDTGAAAGTTQGARRDLYKAHPAFKMGLPIGTYEGASGWQPFKADNGRHWAVINPMWDIYLAARNYLSKNGESHFVERAMEAFRDRLKKDLAK